MGETKDRKEDIGAMSEVPNRMAYDDFLKEVSMLSDKMTLASKEACEGIIHEFSDMPRVIEQLCEEAKSLPKEEQKAIRPKIIGLVDDLDYLVSIIADQLTRVRGNLKESSARHTAAKAYHKPNKPRC